MSVIKSLSDVKAFIGWDKFQIDDIVFRLHCKVTATILLTFSLIVTASQFIGDPIDCIVEDIPQNVMDTYCWIHSTFTLPKKILHKIEGETAHPGVGVPNYDGEETYHKYYQWVAFTLFLQMVLFRLPRLIWHYLEGDRMNTVLPGRFYVQASDKRMPLYAKPLQVVKNEEVDESIAGINDFFVHQMGRFR